MLTLPPSVRIFVAVGFPAAAGDDGQRDQTEYDQCRMQAYHEKPTTHHFVSMGLYVLNRDAIRPHLRKNEYLDMPNLLQAIRDNGGDVRCYHEDCTWLDIGRPDDFARAQEMFRTDRELFLGRPERKLAVAD